MSVAILQGDARHLPLPDGCVDLVVTSPPYFGLRSYTDGCPTCADEARKANCGYRARYCPQCDLTTARLRCNGCQGATTELEKKPPARSDCPDCGGTGQRHYDGQIGSEATPAEWLAAMVECTAEMVRVLRPEGSIFINIGDAYYSGKGASGKTTIDPKSPARTMRRTTRSPLDYGLDYPRKSLLGLPWRYALAATDQLGLILRAEIIWAKPNGLPESVTDRVRRSHEQIFHLVKSPRYYTAIDEIREAHGPQPPYTRPTPNRGHAVPRSDGENRSAHLTHDGWVARQYNPLGKLPGSVWSIPSQPLTVPPALGVDHFAAFPVELPRRIVLGWSPPGVCVACGQGRRPVVDKALTGIWHDKPPQASHYTGNELAHRNGRKREGDAMMRTFGSTSATITSYACACPQPDAPTRPALVLDPFAGTGTTLLAAAAHGRNAIGIDRSADYCRLARWRTSDPSERAKAMQVPKPPPIPDGMEALF